MAGDANAKPDARRNWVDSGGHSGRLSRLGEMYRNQLIEEYPTEGDLSCLGSDKIARDLSAARRAQAEPAVAYLVIMDLRIVNRNRQVEFTHRQPADS